MSQIDHQETRKGIEKADHKQSSQKLGAEQVSPRVAKKDEAPRPRRSQRPRIWLVITTVNSHSCSSATALSLASRLSAFSSPWPSEKYLRAYRAGSSCAGCEPGVPRPGGRYPAFRRRPPE